MNKISNTMNSTLSTIEQDAFMEVVNIGLSKAADALAVMLNEKVLIKCVEMIRPVQVLEGIDEDHLNIVTNIRGDINGTCCFVFTKNDALYLTSKIIPNGNTNNHFVMNKTNKEFLLELDNIISASVTTQLADLLHINIYGDVPMMEPWNTYKNMDLLLEKYHPLFFKTRFRTEDTTFTPGFYWFLEPIIIENIKNLLKK